MFKESIALETLLEIFVAGGIFVIGTWYLHRPFLLEYFPVIAPDAILLEQSKLGGKLLIIFVLAMLAGVFITHMFDAAVPLVVSNQIYKSKRLSKAKSLATFLFRIVLWLPEPDPRVTSVTRYLNSPRKEWFLELARNWCHSSEALLGKDMEKIIVHQHLIARLKSLSGHSREVLQDSYNQVAFSGSIFIAFLSLIPVSLMAFYSQTLVTNYKVFSNTQLTYFSVSIYLLAVVFGFSFRRRLRNFYSGALTLSLHFYEEQQNATHTPKNKLSQTNQRPSLRLRVSR